jgi:Lrp/AsnC family leucine-responsive transcriptional regulator
MNLDALDFKLLRHLMAQGRITWSELASLLGLSAPATADRVRRLEEKQVIQGYTARLNPEAIGCDLMAFLSVTLERPEHRAAFLELVKQRPEIQECHHVAGDDDYWLKVRCRNTRHLEHLISEVIKGIPGVLRTRTTIVLSTVKETADLPLSEEF